LQEGFDPDYHSDRVGFILRAQVLRRLIESSVRRYDFMGGQDTSKERWGSIQTRYLNFNFARPMSFAAGYLRAVHAGYELKVWVRGHVPTSVWNIGKRLYRLRDSTA
jgi:CelD/BcsL family acetyltransferase involved in cellulose biosynthesis